ncbi:hypothetical protein U8C35_06300 [Sinorhizobium medicae]|uniref:hypothetical protein n=1 Tax=Sinorhizobium medicae TaxID=110321 RepID=UPI002AF6B7D5|nr:hypothetical protein [Sinorhizobium medicae]WQO60043.1 hypothetical protein U8C35_06300 [Sinorhizobium medicae]
MKPRDYDTDLTNTIYAEVKFSIDVDQFDPETITLPAEAIGWVEELEDAKRIAQDLANSTGQVVIVEAYGFWGHYGREFVDSFTVQPKTKLCPIEGVRADLAGLGV